MSPSKAATTTTAAAFIAGQSLEKSIHFSAQKKTTPVSLQHLFHYGSKSAKDPIQRLRNSQFLHNELQIRIAQRIIDLENLPLGLSESKHVKKVRQGYVDHYVKVSNFPFPREVSSNGPFTALMRSILQDHSEVVQRMSRGVLDVRQKLNPKDGKFDRKDQKSVDHILDRFFLARIGLRFLVQQHVETENPRPGFAGVIESACRPLEIIERVSRDAMDICRYHLGDAPEVIIEQAITPAAVKWHRNHILQSGGGLSADPNYSENDVAFTYIPGHIEYMMSEVLKNAARATTETHGNSIGKLPPIKVLIVGGEDDVTIRVSDQGGGIKRDDLASTWSYLNSSAGDPRKHIGSSDQEPPVQSDGNKAVLAGFGLGLPLSRLYARYFGGDLDLKSLQGYGTDVYLHLSRLGHNCEALPPAVMNSPAVRDSSH